MGQGIDGSLIAAPVPWVPAYTGKTSRGVRGMGGREGHPPLHRATAKGGLGPGASLEWPGLSGLVERACVVAVAGGGAFECGDLLLDPPPEDADV